MGSIYGEFLKLLSRIRIYINIDIEMKSFLVIE